MKRRYRNKDVFYDFTTSEGVEVRYTPRTLLEALDSVAVEVDYSNYLTDKIERIQEIVRRYSEEHDIPLGLSEKQRKVISDRKSAAEIKKLGEISKDFDRASSIYREMLRAHRGIL